MKKRLFALALVGCMAFSMTAFAEESTEGTSEGSVDLSAVETVTDGKLTVATSPDFAPYEFYAIDEDGTPSLAGFDMALAQYIADYMGLELEVVTVDFDGVLTELQTKSVDLGMAGLSPDPVREAAMDFSDIYYEGGQSLVTVKDNADTYNSTDAVNDPSVSVGAQTGSIQLDLAQKNSPDADIVSLPKVTDIISELLAGKLDAAYIETDVAKSYQKNYPDLEIVADVPYDVVGSSIGVSKGNAELLAAVNEAIAAAKADGSLEEYIAEANALASGEKYEGLLNENGEVAADETEAVTE
ncbi:MAG: transporter substrate-binding domain-containing protein [Lachnospiraceae bacterium]|nr:transporter substrate-binding domain-containing protein [Lachnospiraceae bacterium]